MSNRRRRLRSARQSGAGGSVDIADRLATDIPAHARVVVVDNIRDPYDKDKFTTAFANLRGDPLRKLLARKKIDQEQFDAGRLLQLLLEMAIIGAVRGTELMEAVDGGNFSPEFLSDMRSKSVKKLQECKLFVGIANYNLLSRLLMHADALSVTDWEVISLLRQVTIALELLVQFFRSGRRARYA